MGDGALRSQCPGPGRGRGPASRATTRPPGRGGLPSGIAMPVVRTQTASVMFRVLIHRGGDPRHRPEMINGPRIGPPERAPSGSPTADRPCRAPAVGTHRLGPGGADDRVGSLAGRSPRQQQTQPSQGHPSNVTDGLSVPHQGAMTRATPQVTAIARHRSRLNDSWPRRAALTGETRGAPRPPDSPAASTAFRAFGGPVLAALTRRAKQRAGPATSA